MINLSFLLRTNSFYIPGWSPNENVRVMLFVYDSKEGELKYILEIIGSTNDMGEFWMRPHDELKQYTLFLIGDYSKPLLVRVYFEDYSVSALGMYDRSDPEMNIIEFARPSAFVTIMIGQLLSRFWSRQHSHEFSTSTALLPR